MKAIYIIIQYIYCMQSTFPDALTIGVSICMPYITVTINVNTIPTTLRHRQVMPAGLLYVTELKTTYFQFFVTLIFACGQAIQVVPCSHYK